MKALDHVAPSAFKVHVSTEIVTSLSAPVANALLSIRETLHVKEELVLFVVAFAVPAVVGGKAKN